MRPAFAFTATGTPSAYMVENTTGTSPSGSACYEFQTSPTCGGFINGVTINVSSSSLGPGSTNYINNSLSPSTTSQVFSVQAGTFTLQLAIVSTGTAPAATIRANGTYGTNSGSSGGFLLDCTGGGSGTGYCAQMYTDAGAQLALGGLLNIVTDNSGWNEPGLYIQRINNTNNNSDIRIDAKGTPAVTLDETGQSAGSAQKFQFSAHNGTLRLEGRNGANNAFDSLIVVSSVPNSGNVTIGQGYPTQAVSQLQVVSSTTNLYALATSTAVGGPYGTTISTTGAITTNASVSIYVNTPQNTAPFNITNDSTTVSPEIWSMSTYGPNTMPTTNDMHFYRGEGTKASPTQTLSGDTMWSVGTRGIDQTNHTTQSILAFQAIPLQNISSTQQGGEWEFQGCALNSNVRIPIADFSGSSVTTFTSTYLQGTNTNDNAGGGQYGEYVNQDSGLLSWGYTTATFASISTATLSAGDWNVTGNVYVNNNGCTYSGVAQAAVSLFPNATSTDHVLGYNISAIPLFSADTSDGSATIPEFRVSVNTTTSVYLKALVSYSAGTCRVRGTLTARRAR